jgi:hypothetical protein
MKKRPFHLILLIFSLVLCILLSLKYIETKNSKDYLQESVDQTFKYQLHQVLSSLSMKMSEYSYRTLLSSVSNASSLSELTSYEDMNDNLDISLHNLFIALREERSKDKVLLRLDELREIFVVLVQDPVNHEVTERLIRINIETFFNAKE